MTPPSPACCQYHSPSDRARRPTVQETCAPAPPMNPGESVVKCCSPRTGSRLPSRDVRKVPPWWSRTVRTARWLRGAERLVQVTPHRIREADGPAVQERRFGAGRHLANLACHPTLETDGIRRCDGTADPEKGDDDPHHSHHIAAPLSSPPQRMRSASPRSRRRPLGHPSRRQADPSP